MSREAHVRFWEGLGVRFPRPTRHRHHWTLDVVLGEDERQPCRPTRTALEVVAWLRTLAFNLVSCFRARLPPEGRHLVEWARACELLRDSLVHGRRQEILLAPA
jgi:hypothetical protein